MTKCGPGQCTGQARKALAKQLAKLISRSLGEYALRRGFPAGSQSAGQPNRAWAAPWGGALKPRLYAGRRVLKVRARTHGDRVRTRCCAVLFFFVSRGASLYMLGAARPTGSEGRLWTRGSRVRIPPGPPLARDLKIPRRALFKSAEPRGVVTFVTAAHPHPRSCASL